MSDVWHLMDDYLIDACETAPKNESLLVTANEENVTCPECIKIIQSRSTVCDQDQHESEESTRN